MSAPTLTKAITFLPKKDYAKLSAAQREVLFAMQDHKLVWVAKTDKFFLRCGDAHPQGVRKASVQYLLNAGLITGPLPVPKKDQAKYDASYKMTPAGKATVKAAEKATASLEKAASDLETGA